MKYLCLIYDNERTWIDYSPEEQGKIFAAHTAFTEAAKAAGKYVGGEGLQTTKTAVTVRVRKDQPMYTDGPFAETKEQLGGYYMLECENMEDAKAWAAKIPEAKSGGVEVRPVMVFDDM